MLDDFLHATWRLLRRMLMIVLGLSKLLWPRPTVDISLSWKSDAGKSKPRLTKSKIFKSVWLKSWNSGSNLIFALLQEYRCSACRYNYRGNPCSISEHWPFSVFDVFLVNFWEYSGKPETETLWYCVLKYFLVYRWQYPLSKKRS